MNNARKILIVDDDRMSRLLLNTILSRMSYHVTRPVMEWTAWKNGIALSGSYLMDVGMPGMDGLEVTRD